MSTERFTWRKLSAPKWEDVWPERLSQFSDRLAITALATGKTIRVEVFDISKREAEKLAKEFGGSVGKHRSDWVTATAKPRAPINIRGSLSIVASEEEKAAVKDGVSTLLIPAGMAFGTGEHATTLNCLRFIADIAAEHEDQPWEMLDLGCGTGILALAARALGAKRCLAGDFDPECVKATKANVKVNALRNVTVQKLDVFHWEPERTWDVVTANLYSTILIEIAPKLAASVAPEGTLIVSGVMRDQEADVMKALAKHKLAPLKVARQGKWIAAVLKKERKV
jgi:ribosomal protein L11 methyltransferase